MIGLVLSSTVCRCRYMISDLCRWAENLSLYICIYFIAVNLLGWEWGYLVLRTYVFGLSDIDTQEAGLILWLLVDLFCLCTHHGLFQGQAEETDHHADILCFDLMRFLNEFTSLIICVSVVNNKQMENSMRHVDICQCWCRGCKWFHVVGTCLSDA